MEGALFCHRCGKPQRDDLIERVEPPIAVPEPGAEAEIPRPSPEAVSASRASRSSVMAGLAAYLATSLLGSLIGGISSPIALLLGGFLTIHLYRRGSSAEVPTRMGARMGWMTGLYAFVLLLVDMTFRILLVGASWKQDLLREVERQGAQNPAMKEALGVLSSPAGMSIFLMSMLVFLFIMCTSLTSLGAALAAHWGGGKAKSS